MVTNQEQITQTVQRLCINGSLCLENDPEIIRGSWLVTALCSFVFVLNTCIGLPANIWALWKIAQSKKLSQSNFCIIQHLIASLVGCGLISPAEAIRQGLIFMTDMPNHFLHLTSLFFQFLVNVCIFSCTIYIAVERLQNIRNHFVKKNNFTMKKVILSLLWLFFLPFAITGLHFKNVYGFKDSHFSCQFVQVSQIEQLNCFIQILPFCLFIITLSTVVSVYIVCIIQLRKKTQVVRPLSNVTSVISHPNSSINENQDLFHHTRKDTFASESEGDESRQIKIKAQVEPKPSSFLSSSSTDYKFSTGSSFSSTNPPSSSSSLPKSSEVTRMFAVTETAEHQDPKIGINPELEEQESSPMQDSPNSFHSSKKQKKDEPSKENHKKSKHGRTASQESDYTLEKAFRKMSDISLASITTSTLPVVGSNVADSQKAKYTLNPLRHTRRSAGNVWTLEPIPDFPNTENIWKLKPKIPHKLAPINFQKTSKTKKKKKRKTKMKKQFSNNSIGTCSLTSNKSASSKLTNSEMSEYSSTQSFGKKTGSDMTEPSIADEVISISDTFRTKMTHGRDNLQIISQPAEKDENIATSESSNRQTTQNLMTATNKNQNQKNNSQMKSDAEKQEVQARFHNSTVFNFDSDYKESNSYRDKEKEGEFLSFEDVLSESKLEDNEIIGSEMCTFKNAKSINTSTESKIRNLNLIKYNNTDDEVPSLETMFTDIKTDQNKWKSKKFTNSGGARSFNNKTYPSENLEGRKFQFEKKRQHGEDFNLSTRNDATSTITKEILKSKGDISSSSLMPDNIKEEASGNVKQTNLKDFQCHWKPMPMIVSEECLEDVFLNEETKLNTISKNDRLSDPFGPQDETKTVENLHVPHTKSTNNASISSSSISSSYMLRPSKSKYSSTSTINSCFSRPMRWSGKISATHDQSSDGSVIFYKDSKSEDKLKFMQPDNNYDYNDFNVQFICNNNSDLNFHDSDHATITQSLPLQSYLDDKISSKKEIRERVNEWHSNSRPETGMASYGRLAKSLQDLRKIDRPSIFNIEESPLVRTRSMINSTTQTESEIITLDSKDLLMEQHYLNDNNTSHPIIRVIRPSLPSPKTIENQKKNYEHAKICQAIEEITDEGNVSSNAGTMSQIGKPSHSNTSQKSVSMNQMYKTRNNPFTELNVCATLKRVLLILIPFTILFMPINMEIFVINANYLHTQNYIKISQCLQCIYYSCSSFIYVYSSKSLMKSLKVARQ